MDTKKYHGVIPAFYACYDENGEVSPERVRSFTKYLIEKGVSEDMIIKENKSLTTEENALYSVPICKELNAKKITVITTLEHMSRDFLNPVKLFADQVKDNNITLTFMTNSY